MHRSSQQTLSRRHFMGTALGASFVLPAWAQAADQTLVGEKLTIGLIADVHKDIMHDADSRLKAFVDAMTMAKPKAVLQLGDFCTPKESNKDFLAIFNRFNGPRYHVIGNHETDGGFERADVVKYYGMPSRYYSFDLQGFHFIVLDANDVPEGNTNRYPSHIADDQREWLEEDLAKTQSAVFVFVHQGLGSATAVTGGAGIRKVLSQALLPNGTRKVAAVFNGHHHIDHALTIDGIPYIHINSASYYWMGGKAFEHESYSKEVHKKHPSIRSTAPYKEPLYTMLTINPEVGQFSLAASSTDWQGPSPKEMRFERASQVANGWVAPRISARSIEMPKKS